MSFRSLYLKVVECWANEMYWIQKISESRADFFKVSLFDWKHAMNTSLMGLYVNSWTASCKRTSCLSFPILTKSSTRVDENIKTNWVDALSEIKVGIYWSISNGWMIFSGGLFVNSIWTKLDIGDFHCSCSTGYELKMIDKLWKIFLITKRLLTLLKR